MGLQYFCGLAELILRPDTQISSLFLEGDPSCVACKQCTVLHLLIISSGGSSLWLPSLMKACREQVN